jgi:maleylpyruvate isomerase
MGMILHGYFRSSAAYRVRIALGLKGVDYQQVTHHLRKGEQRTAEYLALNPQGLLPTLVTPQGDVLTQSLAIINWLEATYPSPALYPSDPLQRARALAVALAIAADTHPIQNLKILKRLKDFGLSDEVSQEWARKTNEEGLAACEALLTAGTTRFSFGDTPSIADICLVPQLANARRFGVDFAAMPRLAQIEAACQALPAFAAAAPDRQPDFEP